MLYWKVHNWEKWQSYRKDRGLPPWIKLHRELLRNPEWVKMSDAQRGQLVSVWILASDNDGLVPADEELVHRLGYMTEPFSAELLMDQGFLMRDAKLASEWRQRDANVTPQMQSQKKKKNKNVASADAAAVLAHLNSLTGRNFSNAVEIDKCLGREGCTVEDCKLMLDYKWNEWRGDAKMKKHMNPTTPFRPSHFQDYLDQAKAGDFNSNRGIEY